MTSTEGVEYADIGDFTFLDGTTLSSTRLAYRIFNPNATKTALVPTCFRGRINTTQNFSTGALSSHRVVVVALFGNGESSSPSTTPPDSFPATLDYRDCVHAQHKLLTTVLGVESLDVVVGFSMGGQTAYHWAALYPSFVSHVAIICSSAATSAHNYQFLEGPKTALLHARDYRTDDKSSATKRDKVSLGIQAFGKAYSAWLTSAEWFNQRLWRDMGCETLAQWDEMMTNSGYAGWAEDDLLVMLGMWQRGDIGCCAEDGKTETALSNITAKTLLMPCRTDQYFRPEPNERDVPFIKDGRVSVIESVWGHVAGGGGSEVDSKFMDEQIRALLAV